MNFALLFLTGRPGNGLLGRSDLVTVSDPCFFLLRHWHSGNVADLLSHADAYCTTTRAVRLAEGACNSQFTQLRAVGQPSVVRWLTALTPYTHIDHKDRGYSKSSLGR